VNVIDHQMPSIRLSFYSASLRNTSPRYCRSWTYSGAVKGSDGHIKVWTKCLAQSDMEKVDIEKDFDGKIVKNAAQKVLSLYVPPFGTVETLNKDQAIDIITSEETANMQTLMHAPEYSMRSTAQSRHFES
jgi:hypothetical protein